MEGTQLGSYRVVRVLGKGGMGVVYEAEHVLIGKRAAVKTLRGELSADRDTVQRFFNEARATTQIHHPGIVDVFDFGFASDGTAFIVMELLAGESLGARRRRAAITLGDALAIVRQVASAVGAAHAQQIVHRDLKPDNVFLVPHADMPAGVQVKVLDFGIAKLVRATADDAGSPATRTGALLGTPMYMSPEQCRGIATIDHRADIYALGCILYELVAGRTPFGGEGVGDILIAHVHETPRDPSLDRPELPHDVVALAGHMLAKKPEARPKTMAAVIAEIDRIAGALGAARELALGGRAKAPADTVDAAAETAASTGRDTAPTDADPMAATAAPIPPATERRDPTPAVPVDTTLGGAAGARATARARPTRRAIFVGGGAAIAAAGLYGASRFLGGGRAARSVAAPASAAPPAVRIGFRAPLTVTELDAEPSLVLTPAKGDPIRLHAKPPFRPDPSIKRSLVVVVEGTERYFGNYREEQYPIDGVRMLVGHLLDDLPRVAGDLALVVYAERSQIVRPARGQRVPGLPDAGDYDGVFGSDLLGALQRARDELADGLDRHVLVLGTGNFRESAPAPARVERVAQSLREDAIRVAAIVGDWVDGDRIGHDALARLAGYLRAVDNPMQLSYEVGIWAQELPVAWTIEFEAPPNAAGDALFQLGDVSRVVQLDGSGARVDLGDLPL